MEKQFCTYEIAFKLKQLGFNEDCFGYYAEQSCGTPSLCIYQQENDSCHAEFNSQKQTEAPLWQQVIDWFREKFYMELSIQFDDNSNKYYYFLHTNIRECCSNRICSLSNSTNRIFNTYLDVREAVILKALELTKI